MTEDSPPPRPSVPGPRPDLLDAAAVAALEDLLRLGAAALGVERCVVGLVSPRDGWIRTVVGVAAEDARKYAGFCSYAMAQGGVAVVADMRESGALAHLPQVRFERGYRMLACAPIVDATGVRRGGVAALAGEARELTARERDALDALARQVLAQLESRRRIHELSARGLHQAGMLSMLRGVLKASTTVAVIGTDLTGRIKLFSEGAERLFGVTAREASGRSPAFLLPGAAVGPGERAVAEVTARPPAFSALVDGVTPETPLERTWLLRRAGGAVFPAAVVTAVVTGENGEVTGYALIARDITEQLAMERMKDDFVSMVSHELRTPLTSIRGALGLLAGEVAGPLAPGVSELVEIAQANSDRLLYVVNDILDMQRLASGKLELQLGEIDLRRVVERALALVGPVSDARGVTVALRSAPEPALVVADFERVVQMLVNLLSNAVKHSSAGRSVHVDIEPVEGGLRVSVEDAGPGVPEPMRDRLFQKFARLSADSGGTGLGLAIVKALVTLHGGTVAYRPAFPHGAIFSFILPYSPTSVLGDAQTIPDSVPTLTNPVSARAIELQRATVRPPPPPPPDEQ